MNKTIVAIDPGKKGGIAWQPSGGLPACMAMPETEGDILGELRNIFHMAPEADQKIAFIENVGGFTGGKGQPGSGMFKFGRNFGFCLGVLQAIGFQVHLVQPAAWQKPLGIGTAVSSGSKKIWKNKLKAKAQQLYPNQNVTLSTADALLILEHGRKTLV